MNYIEIFLFLDPGTWNRNETSRLRARDIHSVFICLITLLQHKFRNNFRLIQIQFLQKVFKFEFYLAHFKIRFSSPKSFSLVREML